MINIHNPRTFSLNSPQPHHRTTSGEKTLVQVAYVIYRKEPKSVTFYYQKKLTEINWSEFKDNFQLASDWIKSVERMYWINQKWSS